MYSHMQQKEMFSTRNEREREREREGEREREREGERVGGRRERGYFFASLLDKFVR